MSGFWIIGIVVNVTLTSLALWWLFKEMRPKDKAQPTDDENNR